MSELPDDAAYVIQRATFCRQWGLSWAEYDQADAREIGIVDRFSRKVQAARRRKSG